MQSNNKSSRVSQLTFGSLLRTLKSLSARYYRNQVSMYVALFRSYCQSRGVVDDIPWEPSQGSISRLFQDKQAPSWHQYNYYINVDQSRIRNDVEQYLQVTTATAKQRRLHLDQLAHLVADSNNLDESDKAYILQYTDVGEEKALAELLYRILVILYNEPFNAGRQ